MSVQKRIRDALLPFGDPVQKEPFAPEADAEKPERYYTMRISTAGANNADNAPQHERCSVLVHLVCPLSWDATNRVEQTKRALFSAGTTWPFCEDGSDNDAQDFIFECELAQGVDL